MLLKKRKQGFLAMSIIDVVSWILFVLACILFYFIFKISAQQASITVSSSINRDSFFPSLYLLKSPYSNSLSVAEVILNSYESKDFKELDDLFSEKYYFIDEEGNPYYWRLSVCGSEESIKGGRGCYANSMRGVITYYNNNLSIQLPNHYNAGPFVSFIYAPGYYLDLTMSGGMI